jgi:hypothetical protein
MNHSYELTKPKCVKSYEKWNKIKNSIIWLSKKNTNYPFITICPHCGILYKHTMLNDDGIVTIREYKYLSEKIQQIYYDCPGYKICRQLHLWA